VKEAQHTLDMRLRSWRHPSREANRTQALVWL